LVNEKGENFLRKDLQLRKLLINFLRFCVLQNIYKNWTQFYKSFSRLFH
jgi:hypothetical protein